MYALFFHSGNKHGVCGECRCGAAVALKQLEEWVLLPAIVCPSVWLYLTTHTQPRRWLLVLSSTNCVWSGPLANPWQTWCGVCVCVWSCVCLRCSLLLHVYVCAPIENMCLYLCLCVCLSTGNPQWPTLSAVFFSRKGLNQNKNPNENLAWFS